MLSTLTHYAGHSLADVLAMSAETRLSLYKKFNQYAALLTVFPAEVVAEMNQAQRDAEFKVFCARSKEEKLKEARAMTGMDIESFVKSEPYKDQERINALMVDLESIGA